MRTTLAAPSASASNNSALIESILEAAARPSEKLSQSENVVHNRMSHRVPYDGLLTLRGLNTGQEPVDDEITVTARDISSDGISFFHEGPLPYRLVELILDTSHGQIRRLMKLTWCRYSIDGQYVSGGYFFSQPPSNP